MTGTLQSPSAQDIPHNRPLVSVICISHNQVQWVEACLQSVWEQTYPAVELIIVDNGSQDGTRERIEALLADHPETVLIANPDNRGICRAFNQGLERASGAYVIDLSADDRLHPDRITRQVAAFEELPLDYGVIFGNAALIGPEGRPLGYHFPVDQHERTRVSVPTGWMFATLLRSYVVCTPTMMIRRSVLDELGGYDESLAYEDFDFWVRSGRSYRYYYQDAVLTQKRFRSNSLSTGFLRPRNELLPSTLKVCYKAFDQCITPDEYNALASRVRWSIRQSFYAQEYTLAFQFAELLQYLAKPDWQTKLILQLCRWRLPINPFYRLYYRWVHARPGYAVVR